MKNLTTVVKHHLEIFAKNGNTREFTPEEIKKMNTFLINIENELATVDEIEVDGTSFYSQEKLDIATKEAAKELSDDKIDQLIQAAEFEITKLPPENKIGHEYWDRFVAFLDENK